MSTCRHRVQSGCISLGNSSATLTVTRASPICQICCAPSAGGSTLLPESRTLDVLSWVDWEETTLREAVLSQDAESIHQAVQHLQSALGSKDYMVGDVVTLADVVIYLALLPVQVSKQQLRPKAAAACFHAT